MKKLAAFLLAILPLLSFAHPGHGNHDHDGTGGFTVIHYITEPEHAIITLLSLAIVVFAVVKLSSKKDSRQS